MAYIYISVSIVFLSIVSHIDIQMTELGKSEARMHHPSLDVAPAGGDTAWVV